MKPKIKLTVPKPCEQTWDAMLTIHRDKHCTACNKTVIDFSGYSNEQLLTYFTSHKQNTCGRFLTTQLNTPLDQKHKNGLRVVVRVAAFFSSLYLSNTAHAQRVTIQETNQFVPVSIPTIQAENEAEKTQIKTTDSVIQISGFVTDFSLGEVIPFAGIRILNGDVIMGNTQADINGAFYTSVPITDELNAVTVQCTYIGMNMYSKTLKLDSLQNIDIILNPVLDYYTVGAIVSFEKQSTLHRVTKPFKQMAHAVRHLFTE